MTVEELIQMLQRWDPKLPVMTYDRYGSVEDVVKLTKLDWDEGDKVLISSEQNK